MIDFLISHMGWFVGFFFICFFATVGYFSEKNEEKNKSKEVADNINVVNNSSSEDVNSIYDMNPVEYRDGSSGDVTSDFVSNYEGVVSEKTTEPVDYSIDVDGSNNFVGETSSLEWNGSDDEDDIIISKDGETFNNDLINSTVSNGIPNSNESVSNDLNSLNDSDLSFESVDMTLDDLEREDIDITNDSMGVSNSDVGLIDDYNDDDINSSDLSDEDDIIIPRAQDKGSVISNNNSLVADEDDIWNL